MAAPATAPTTRPPPRPNCEPTTAPVRAPTKVPAPSFGPAPCGLLAQAANGSTTSATMMKRASRIPVPSENVPQLPNGDDWGETLARPGKPWAQCKHLDCKFGHAPGSVSSARNPPIGAV